jgi:hypothetical protein
MHSMAILLADHILNTDRYLADNDLRYYALQIRNSLPPNITVALDAETAGKLSDIKSYVEKDISKSMTNEEMVKCIITASHSLWASIAGGLNTENNVPAGG